MKVPWSESDRVYDVRYHSRDSRRKFEPVLHGTVGSTTEVNAATLFAETSKNASGVQAFTPGARHGSQRHPAAANTAVLVGLLTQPARTQLSTPRRQ